MSEREYGPDEWDPPMLHRHMPFPPPIGPLDLNALETIPLALLGIEWMNVYGGHGLTLVFVEFHVSAWPWWTLPMSIAIGGLYVLNMIRWRGHRTLAWPFVVGRHLLLVALAPLAWWVGSTADTPPDLAVRRAPLRVRQLVQTGSNGTRHFTPSEEVVEYQPLRAGHAHRARGRVPYRFARHYHRGGVRGWLVALLPRDVGHWLHASARVLADGVLDTSGRLGPRGLRWAFGWLLGVQQLTALVWLSDTGNLDILDPEARKGVWAARNELFRRLRHSLSLYLRVRPFPVHELLVASGSVGAEAEAAERVGGQHPLLNWARTMVRRRLVLAVPAARRRVLAERMLALLGLPDQPGKLAQAGLVGEPMAAEEALELLDDAWGPEHRPAIAVAPGWVEVETGSSDPPPLGETELQPSGGNPGVRRHRTYVVTGLPDRVGVGYTEPLTGRRIVGDLAIHVQPVSDGLAHTWLGLKEIWWRGLTLGRKRYAHLADQVERTLELLRRRESKVLRVGMYFTGATTQQPAIELALEEMVGRENVQVASWDQQRARTATEPTGRDGLNKRIWTDSQTVSAAWPGTGGIWVPGAILLGQSARSPEPIGINPWWGGGNSALCIMGGVGSGKTNAQQVFCARVMRPHPEHWLARELRRPPRVIVTYLKPDDEWSAFCRFFGGKHYRPRNAEWRGQLASAPMDASIVAFNLVSLADAEQVAFLSAMEEWVEQHQARDARHREPLVYVIGEAWAWAQDPDKARHLKKYALQVRLLKIALVVDTQFLDHLLESDARDLPRACSMWVVMRTNTSERDILGRQLDIGPEGMRFLNAIAQPNVREGGRQAISGQGIIHAHGLTTTLQVKRFGWEVRLLDRTSATRDEDDELYAVDEVEGIDARARLEKLGLQLARG